MDAPGEMEQARATSLGLAGCRLCHGAARRLRMVAQLRKGGRG